METIVFTGMLLSEGALRFPAEERDGFISATYVFNNRTTFILESEEIITETVVKMHLDNLGLSDLWDRALKDLI